MWNHSKSLQLTALWTKVALVGWLAAAVLLPMLLPLYQQYSEASVPIGFLLFVFYLVFLPVLLIIYSLNCMLNHFRAGQVFFVDNVAQLRRISWCCFFAALILFIAALLEPWLVFLSGVIGFFGLLMRVVKNLLAEAILLKEENDYTI